MYSGTTLTKYSGRVIGAHQKIDRIARRHLSSFLIDNSSFPLEKTILQFEGKNGPDAIKRKSPAKDKPWHYIDPFDENDTQLLVLIEEHFKQLAVELKGGNGERAGFEAAWLAHALVDGMTPAHHFPYEQELMKLRGGERKEIRNTWKKKIVIPGDTTSEKLQNNWKMWGPKGLLMAHFWFEIGVAGVMTPLSFAKATPTIEELVHAEDDGLKKIFIKSAREIAVLGMYDDYYRTGWTPKLARSVKNKLAPTMIKTVTIIWYLAAKEADLTK